MASVQIYEWETVFNFELHNIPNETINLLSKFQFDGEGNISANDHIYKFLCKCINYNITDLCGPLSFATHGKISIRSRWVPKIKKMFFS